MVEWVVQRNQQSFERDLFDVEITDTANPFGNVAVFRVDDINGNKFEQYPRGTRVDIYYSTQQSESSLTIPESETVTVSQEVETFQSVDDDGTLRVGSEKLEVQSTDTQSINDGETETYGEVAVDGTLQVSGTLQSGADTTLRLGRRTGIRRFTGYVVERRETEQSGADALEIEAYTFDQFLRRNNVTAFTEEQTIFDALQEIIQDDTPVNWNPNLVEIGDPQTLTQEYNGDKVENAIQSIRAKSVNEDFGVTPDNEFFFRPTEESQAPRDIDNSQWTNYDIPERGKRSVNQVTVYYAQGDESVTVSDGADQQELQDNLGIANPVTFEKEVTRENITNITDARAVGEQILQDREPLLTGTVTTYGLYAAEPGDTINITIAPRGIDEEFRIAEIKYIWGTDETILTIVEKRGNQDDLLVELSDTVERVEMRPANRASTPARVTNTNAGLLVSPSGNVDGFEFESVKITNTLRNKLRDNWIDNSTITVSDIAVGNGTTPPSRTQTSLENELERQSASQSLPDSTSAEYTASFSTTDIREIGLFDSSGDMLLRATLADESLSNSDVTLSIGFDDDSSINRGVITTSGQTTYRDILADNNPKNSEDYAYGNDSTTPAESDTALGNQLTTASLREVLLQSADTQTEWEDLLSLDQNTPLYIENGKLKLAQTAWVYEGENNTLVGTRGDGDYSNGEATFIETNSGEPSTTLTFTPEYTISKEDVGIAFRIQPIDGSGDGISDTPEYKVELNGEEVFREQRNTNILDLTWETLVSGYNGLNLDAGTQQSLTITVTDDSQGTVDDELRFDLFAFYDTRFTYNFDNDNGGNSGYLDGPQLHPASQEKEFPNVTTERPVTGVFVNQIWDDVSNNQRIQASNDGFKTSVEVNNSQTLDATFSDIGFQLGIRARLSRYGNRTTATPQTGFLGQAIDLHELFADILGISADGIGLLDHQAIVPERTIETEIVREGGILATDGTLLTRTLTSEFEVLPNQRIISSEAIEIGQP